MVLDSLVIDVASLLSMIRSNVERYGIPLPMKMDELASWAEGLDIPGQGDYMLFTGGLYQAMPYIEALYEGLRKLERSSVSGLALKIASKISKAIDFSKLVAKPSKELAEEARRILRSIYLLLHAAGVKVYYIPEADGYNGALLYDLGLEKSFANYARQVYQKLREHGVKRIVTVDPHSTHMLRSIYPKYVSGYELEVKSYLELLADNIDKLQFKSGSAGKVVIHDPCLYARFEDVIEQPRKLLAAAGYEVVEPRRSRKLTYCCGGPIESIAPSLSEAIASKRMEELVEYADTIVTLCPICFLNLNRVAPSGVRVKDISVLLAERLAA
jgi:Fe-S oxidoreductase